MHALPAEPCLTFDCAGEDDDLRLAAYGGPSSLKCGFMLPLSGFDNRLKTSRSEGRFVESVAFFDSCSALEGKSVEGSAAGGKHSLDVATCFFSVFFSQLYGTGRASSCDYAQRASKQRNFFLHLRDLTLSPLLHTSQQQLPAKS